MDPVTGLSLGRIAIGAVALARPGLAGRMLQLDPAANPQVSYVGRMFGSREVVLGALTLAARGRARRRLLLAGVAVDLADAATGVLGARNGEVTPRAGAGLAAPAVGAVVTGLLGLRRG